MRAGRECLDPLGASSEKNNLGLSSPVRSGQALVPESQTSLNLLGTSFPGIARFPSATAV